MWRTSMSKLTALMVRTLHKYSVIPAACPHWQVEDFMLVRRSLDPSS